MKKVVLPVAHPLLDEARDKLDRMVALLEEDQALRHAEYDKPDPKRRRLRVACNRCETPWCCNQRVAVEFVEALVIYRWAAEHEPLALAAAIARGDSLRRGRPLDDAEFFRRRVPCPFLIKGRCTIFPMRPHSCRSHYMGGNPLKCRDELQPNETYEMSPDRALIAEIAALADDVKFDLLIEGARPTELAELMLFVDRLLARKKTWAAPRVLDWDLAPGEE